MTIQQKTRNFVSEISSILFVIEIIGVGFYILWIPSMALQRIIEVYTSCGFGALLKNCYEILIEENIVLPTAANFTFGVIQTVVVTFMVSCFAENEIARAIHGILLTFITCLLVSPFEKLFNIIYHSKTLTNELEKLPVVIQFIIGIFFIIIFLSVFFIGMSSFIADIGKFLKCIFVPLFIAAAVISILTVYEQYLSDKMINGHINFFEKGFHYFWQWINLLDDRYVITAFLLIFMGMYYSKEKSA